MTSRKESPAWANRFYNKKDLFLTLDNTAETTLWTFKFFKLRCELLLHDFIFSPKEEMWGGSCPSRDVMGLGNIISLKSMNLFTIYLFYRFIACFYTTTNMVLLMPKVSISFCRWTWQAFFSFVLTLTDKYRTQKYERIGATTSNFSKSLPLFLVLKFSTL